ncbi:MAG: flagellar hook-length control protein FliK [Rhodobacteraceae bacterium]|nr:flagellar hook-length control protein FliK [Paracoccaceae bacterium]
MQQGTVRPPAPGALPKLAASPPPPFSVAKLAETALQSLFAAQSEQAAQEPEDQGPLLSPLTQTAVPGAPLSAAIQAATLPGLAAQLVQTLAQRPDGTTEIALSPDELGHVRVTLQADAQNPDRIIVMLNFERPETLDLFRRHADQLADALRDAGFSGADIGFGRSDGGENRDSPADAPLDMLATDTSLADLPSGLAQPHPALRLAATGTLDLRL